MDFKTGYEKMNAKKITLLRPKVSGPVTISAPINNEPSLTEVHLDTPWAHRTLEDNLMHDSVLVQTSLFYLQTP